MIKKTTLYVLTSVLAISLCCSSASNALSGEHQQLLTKVKQLQSYINKTRKTVDAKEGNPESVLGDYIGVYGNGNTKIYFNGEKKKPSRKDVVTYITVDVPEGFGLSVQDSEELFGSDGIKYNEKGQVRMVYDNSNYHLLMAFDGHSICNKIQIFEISN